MQKTLKWGLTRQFILFFTLGAILPVVLLGIFIMGRAYWRMSDRQNQLLHTCEVLTQALIDRDKNSLQLAVAQAADSVMSDPLKDYELDHDRIKLEKQLSRFIKHSKLNFIGVYDNHNNIVLAYDNGKFKSKLSDTLNKQLQPLLRKSNKNIEAASIEEFTLDNRPSNLFYTAYSPIHNSENYTENIGTLVYTKSMHDLLALDEIKAALPTADMTLIRTSANETIYTTNASFNIANIERAQLKNHVQYTSFYIYNSSKKPVGEIIIHSHHIDLSNFLESGFFWVIGCVVLGLILITIMGFYLHHSFVEPVTRVANALQLISKGKMDTVIDAASSKAEMKSLISHFNKMVAELKQADESRENYIAALTHDLKTPLIAESRVFEIFQDTDEFPDELRPLLGDLQDSNKHQLDMVNELLVSYHFEAGEIPLNLSLIDINQLIESKVKHLEHLATKNGVKLRHIHDAKTPQVVADERQLRRVFTNIMMNAIENIPPIGNQIEIYISASPETHFCTITITDNGPGIPVEIIPNWFERYAGNQLNKKIGSGLGLSICKKIIEQHKGNISINDAMTSGTQFIINIPYVTTQSDNYYKRQEAFAMADDKSL